MGSFTYCGNITCTTLLDVNVSDVQRSFEDRELTSRELMLQIPTLEAGREFAHRKLIQNCETATGHTGICIPMGGPRRWLLKSTGHK